MAGGRKAPRHEIAKGVYRRYRGRYGDFAAGFGLLRLERRGRCARFSSREAGSRRWDIAETEQCANLEAAGDGQQTPRLILAHHQRDPLRLADVINLGGKIQSPQRHTQQELQPGHDPIAVADARASLGQVQLKQPDVFSRGRVGGPLQKRSESLAAVNVAPLSVRTKLACVHILDHALTQRADGIRTHRKLLSRMRLTTPRSSRQDATDAIDDLHPGYRTRGRATPRSGLSRSDLVLWP